MDESTLMAAGMGIFGLIMALIGMVVGLVVLIGMWKMYAKAGKPGWACIVPIYNLIVLLDIIGKPVWWIVLYFIPVVNAFVSLFVIFSLAGVFGKGAGFGIGLVLFPAIFIPVLGFGGARYQRPTY
ncbi:MAG: DUF5684 domain-containing protein [Pseudomonadota bacterium]